MTVSEAIAVLQAYEWQKPGLSLLVCDDDAPYFRVPLKIEFDPNRPAAILVVTDNP